MQDPMTASSTEPDALRREFTRLADDVIATAATMTTEINESLQTILSAFKRASENLDLSPCASGNSDVPAYLVDSHKYVLPIATANTDATIAMSSPDIAGCVEIDGPPVAWFCDGEDDIEYTKLSLSLNDAGSMENLILEMHAHIQKIRNRSNVILWRTRPRLTFRYIGTADNPRKGPKYDGFYPEKEDYEQCVATIQISCRLACYPPLTDAEALTIGARQATNGTGDSLVSPTTRPPTGDDVRFTTGEDIDGNPTTKLTVTVQSESEQ